MKTELVTRAGVDPFGIIIHPSPTAKAIIINCPGWRSDINGFNNKYGTMGSFLSRGAVGAFVQMPNIERPLPQYRQAVIDDLRAVCDWTLAHAGSMCATDEPDLLLMGFSAGGGAVAAVAHDHPVKKILLIAPSGDAAQGPVEASLRSFGGEVFITIGDRDSTVGPEAGQKYFNLVKRASRKEFVIVSDCDHQFRGRRNGQILAKAPLWAFAGDTTFPCPEGGVVLYE